jgi:hypothetical protein
MQEPVSSLIFFEDSVHRKPYGQIKSLVVPSAYAWHEVATRTFWNSCNYMYKLVKGWSVWMFISQTQGREFN